MPRTHGRRRAPAGPHRRRAGRLVGGLAAVAGLVVAAAVGAPYVMAGSTPGQAPAAPRAAAFQAGVTHTQYSADEGDASAVASAKGILKTVGPLENQHIMGWGADNPEPSPGKYDWTTLDQRMKLISDTAGTPVITLCGAPDWMKGGQAGQTDWNKLEVAPLPAHYADFANLAVTVAKRYPKVKYFQVWNEMKGLWDDGKNRWNYEAYTTLYNTVYDALKKYNKNLIIGGPYVSLNTYHDPDAAGHPSSVKGAFGTVDQRDLDAISYWLKNKHGADFLDLDGGTNTRDGYFPSPADGAQMFQAVTKWLKQQSSLPVWWAEFYTPKDKANNSSPEAVKDALTAMRDGGASVALLWSPQCDGAMPCLWTDTRKAGGGKATAYLPVLQQFAAR